MAAKKEVEVVEVQADFKGIAIPQNNPQPPTINELILSANAAVMEYINALQIRINELEAEAQK